MGTRISKLKAAANNGREVPCACCVKPCTCSKSHTLTLKQLAYVMVDLVCCAAHPEMLSPKLHSAHHNGLGISTCISTSTDAAGRAHQGS